MNHAGAGTRATPYAVDEGRVRECAAGPNRIVLETMIIQPIRKGRTPITAAPALDVPRRTCCASCGRPFA